ncbi:MAG: prepilin-type N-terminal cleavage/methylation domain-containing protein [Halanaerobiales bacterium]|nr:prepilin-type N-terminal cleavage/methylation domain-containing protein [Halanaerobiales bacterium]
MLVNNKGFTLIELLVVIAVLGILAAIAIPRLTGVTEKARVSALKSSGSSVRSAIEMNIADTGNFPNVGSSGPFGGDELTFTSDYDIGVNLDEYYLNVVDGDLSDGEGYEVELQAGDTDDGTGGTGAIVTITPSGVSVSG